MKIRLGELRKIIREEITADVPTPDKMVGMTADEADAYASEKYEAYKQTLWHVNPTARDAAKAEWIAADKTARLFRAKEQGYAKPSERGFY